MSERAAGAASSARSGAEPIRVLVVDDHALFRRGAMDVTIEQRHDHRCVQAMAGDVADKERGLIRLRVEKEGTLIAFARLVEVAFLPVGIPSATECSGRLRFEANYFRVIHNRIVEVACEFNVRR